jgi:D-ornithine 4,5-aminomutase subunit alpha
MDDFAARRQHLAGLSNEQLRARFWELAHAVVAPMVELARTHTSPSIERSVLLRMGFSSLEAKAIVDVCAARGFLGKGAGGVVYRVALAHGLSVAEAGRALARGELWESLSGGEAGAAARRED